ncbi:DUF2799 domain-containing protein [Photobacterium carnosum]|uniref:DUF2799 domain-containing protein n=1 Tax=Photobacterium carnosum TaxID=2023717 RepID=UPI001E41153E|nr:DUF2799 domain-containing protein [Photobacterium carnosum]MCD9496666.1 DUF2799 domain-containing protein [Photobacterium carnosum]MCD9527143.1 DUF2799 domain-containing protein [Photobacterium carnosum]
MIKKVLFTVVIGALMTGCVTQKKLVTNGDFHQLGFYNGIAGSEKLSHDNLDVITKKYDPTMTLDYGSYQQGYQQGLDQHCSLEHIFKLGEQGKVKWGICEYRRQQEGLYLTKWQQGFERYGTMEPRL